MIAALLLAAGLASAADYPLPEPPAVSTTSTLLRFSADHLDYEASSTTLHLRGHVRLVESSRTIKGDELWLDPTRRAGRSNGYLFVEDSAGAVASERGGEFDFESGTGRLAGVSAGHGDWRVHAREARLSGRDKLDYLSADFTSCDAVPPHYHFHAGRITVKAKSHLLARNVVFFLGPMPLFYTPILYKSLDAEGWLRMKFQPGYDRRNGAYLKGTMFTRLSPYVYNKLYLDFYSAQGLGVGTELIRKRGDDRGVITGYRIRENSSGTERWAMAGEGYQTLVSSLSAQLRAQVQSDADFNNHYARSSSFRVTPQLDNSAALVYRQPKVTTRLSYARQDIASPDRVHFIKTAESYPRLDVQSAPLEIARLPWLNTLSAFADNNFALNRPYIQKSAGAAWEVTRTLNLARGLAFIPRANYQETWYDRIDVASTALSSTTLQDAFIGRYLTEGTLRWATRAGDWDLTQTYQKRLKADAMSEDASALDHGVEQNLLALRDAYRPSRALLLRASSAYDFRVFRDRTVGFRERVQPIVAEAVYSPRYDLNVTLRDDYQLQRGNRSFIASLLRGDEEKTFYSVGAGYNLASADTYSLDTQFALANASATWRVGGALRSELGTAGGIGGLSANRFRLFEKELTIARAWHDFFTRLMVRFRPGGVREATVRIELRFGKGRSRSSMPRRDWETEWFPERSTGVHDRP